MGAPNENKNNKKQLTFNPRIPVQLFKIRNDSGPNRIQIESDGIPWE